MGIDQDLFLSPVHNSLLCAICLNVFENPVYLPLCRHVFCSTCISTWFDQARSNNSIEGRPNNNSVLCPIDKTLIKTTKEKLLKNKVSYALTNIINDSILVCKNHLNGCKETFALSSYYEHIKNCKFKSDNEDQEQVNANQANVNQANANESVNQSTINESVNQQSTSSVNQQSISANQEKSSTIKSSKNQNKLTDNQASNVDKTKRNQFYKDELTLCNLKHPIKNSLLTYSHANWSKVESNEQNLIKIIFSDFHSYYKPYSLASYIKNLIKCDVYCVHTESTFPADLKKTLSAYCKESDCDKILKSELWPTRVTLTASFDCNKTIIVKGSLKTLRKNFYGFKDESIERKELRKKRKIENDVKGSKKKRRNYRNKKRKLDGTNLEVNNDESKNKKSA